MAFLLGLFLLGNLRLADHQTAIEVLEYDSPCELVPTASTFPSLLPLPPQQQQLLPRLLGLRDAGLIFDSSACLALLGLLLFILVLLSFLSFLLLLLLLLTSSSSDEDSDSDFARPSPPRERRSTSIKTISLPLGPGYVLGVADVGVVVPVYLLRKRMESRRCPESH